MAGLWAVICMATTASWADGGAVEDSADISESARQQIVEILALKDSFTPAEQKLPSNLAFASRQARGLPTGPVAAEPRSLSAGMVDVEINANVSDKLLARITALSGTVKMQLANYHFIRATIPLSALHLLAEDPDVLSIREPSLRKTSVGALTSQGYISHRARAVVASGINGSGVKVGVLSDSASSNSIALLKTSGDLGTNTTVLQDIFDGPGADEGTAMMEIIQDLAPGAQLYFASAYNGVNSFAQNINTLAQAGCSIIVDNVSYSTESVFQDGVIAQAINTFTASGGLYITAAGNQGNLNSGTSSTWQGDFVSGGAVAPPITETGLLHSFSGQNFNRLLTTSAEVSLQWSDPWGSSGNDYDLFILNSAGTTVVGSSTATQNGASNPFEECYNPAGFPANSRVVIVRSSGSPRALFLNRANLGGSLQNTASLQLTTSGNISGHRAAQNALTVAACGWDSAGTGTKPFYGTNNPTQRFSADGPRRIFFNPNGTPITPGNVLFATSGGTNLQKPEVTGADGVFCKTPGFHPFFGTSPAAAHVAGIAALVKSAKPSLTGAQIRQILISTAMDNMAPGADINGGYGVVNAQAAVNAALAP